MEGVVKSLILSQLLLETNDTLVGSKFYRQEFKRDLNRCITSLEAFTERYYSKMYNNDPQMATNVINKLETLVTAMSTSSIEELAMIGGLIENISDEPIYFNKIQ